MDPGTLRGVAPGARSDEVLEASGAALGPRIEVVAVLGPAAAAATESAFQLGLATGLGHPFAVLLAGEAAYRVPASDVPGVDDGSGDE